MPYQVLNNVMLHIRYFNFNSNCNTSFVIRKTKVSEVLFTVRCQSTTVCTHPHSSVKSPHQENMIKLPCVGLPLMCRALQSQLGTNIQFQKQFQRGSIEREEGRRP